MLNMFRSGSKMIHASTHDLQKTIDYFESHLRIITSFISTDFHLSHAGFSDLFNQADEGMTIFFIKENSMPPERYYIALSAYTAERALLMLINEKIDFIENLTPGPRIIMMRVYGDIEKVIDRVQLDFPGQIVDPGNSLVVDRYGTMILFTPSSLSSPICFDEVYSKALFSGQNYHQVLHDLRIYNLKYLNAGIGNADWHELKIKIYDLYGAYTLHYKRLLFIFEKLELGLILGESWGTDAATMFQAVGVYKIRFFTIHEPEYIKRIMIGLEYLEDGTRVVDYDLFYKRRKIYWGDLTGRSDNNKETLGLQYRHDILARLTQEDLNTLLAMEEEIRATRYY
jgi:hypothetical protein